VLPQHNVPQLGGASQAAVQFLNAKHPTQAANDTSTEQLGAHACMQQQILLRNTFTYRIWISCGEPCWAAACMNGSQPMGLRLSAAKASKPASSTACVCLLCRIPYWN
jgi:hypothetical protein